jgi:hypothetical protein
MPRVQTRRRLLAMLPLAGASSLMRAPPVWAAGERLETTSVAAAAVPWHLCPRRRHRGPAAR